MASGLTADDVLLLSKWAASADGSTSGNASDEAATGSPEAALTCGGDASMAVADGLQYLFGIPGDDDHKLAAADAPRRTRKKRRATYLRNREERENLKEEIASLESRLAVLKKRAGLTGGAGSSGIEVTAVNNALLRSVIHKQQMAMANVQSMMTKSVNVQESHPLYTPVHLGKEWPARRQTMASLKVTKMRTVFQYLTERSRHHDELLPHSSQEVLQDYDGNVICTQFDIVQFTGVRSLREVYDATHYFFLNEEMVLSERLGHLAIRDDYDIVDGVAVNSRMYWIDQHGVMTEWNAVSFAQLFDGDMGLDGCKCGVLTTDNVDTDALYPYQSANRVRKDLSGAIMLTVAKASETTTSSVSSKEGDSELVVVMRRAAVFKLHHPHFPISQTAKETLVKGIFGWTQAMTDTIRAQLSASKPAAH